MKNSILNISRTVHLSKIQLLLFNLIYFFSYTFLLILSHNIVYGHGSSSNVTIIYDPPSIKTDSMSWVSEHEVRLYCSVNPKGLNTSVYFEYDTRLDLSNSKRTTMKRIDPVSDYISINIELTGLISPAIYYFRAVALNSSGVSRGLIKSFIVAG